MEPEVHMKKKINQILIAMKGGKKEEKGNGKWGQQ